MSKFFIHIFLITINCTVFSQGILINGARVVLQGGSNVVIAGNGNWTNNGTATCNSASTVIFAGTSNQTISGTNTTSFGNLTINNTGGDVIIGRDISVQSTLLMSSGDLDLKDYTVDLGATGSLSNEASTRRIKATDGSGTDGMGTGTIIATRTNPSGNVAGLGLNITPSGNLGSTVVIRGHERQQGTGTYAGNYSVLRYYEVQPTTYNDFDFVFNYYPAWELNWHTDGSLIAFQRVQYTWGGAPGPIYWRPLTTVNASPTATATTETNVLTNVRLTLASNASPLPVELISFDGYCEGDSKVLEWETASEINNDYFELEASENGEYYQYLATIQGSGTSNELHEYQYIDYTAGNTYYRLKQVDYNGEISYTTPIKVNCEQTEPEVSIYNPGLSSELYISISNTKGEVYNVVITDNIGQILYKGEIKSRGEDYIEKINLNSKSRGVYNVTVYNKEYIKTEQIILCGYKTY